MVHWITTPTTDDVERAKAAVQELRKGDRVSDALGVEVIDVVPGRVRVAMTVRADMLNGHGTCHGGFLFALADIAFALASNSYGDPMTGAGASIEFVAPTHCGARLQATASAVSRNERNGIYDVLVNTAEGQVLAHFRGRCSRLLGSPIAWANEPGNA